MPKHHCAVGVCSSPEHCSEIGRCFSATSLSVPLKGNHSLNLLPSGGVPVVTIKSDGRVFWRGREVETDDDFRAAMMDLKNTMTEFKRGVLG